MNSKSEKKNSKLMNLTMKPKNTNGKSILPKCNYTINNKRKSVRKANKSKKTLKLTNKWFKSFLKNTKKAMKRYGYFSFRILESKPKKGKSYSDKEIN